MKSSTIITFVAFVLIAADLVGVANLYMSHNTTQSSPQPSSPKNIEKSHLTQLMNERKFGQLEEEVRVLLQKNPSHHEYRRLYAMVLYFNGNCALAIEYYSKLISDYPHDMDLRTGRAKCFLALKEFERSEQDYKFVIERQKDHQEALEGLAQIKNIIEHEQNSKLDLKTRNLRQASLLLAEEYKQKKNYVKAIKILKEMVSQNPDDIEVNILLARNLVLAGNLNDGKSLYEKLKVEHPENADLITGEGFLFLQLKDYIKAGANFQKALALDKNNDDAQLGLSLISKSSHPAKTIEQSDEANHKLKSINAKVAILFNNKNYIDAENELLKALKTFPGNDNLEYELARAVFFQSKYSEALNIINKLIVVFPKNADYHNLRGNLYLAENKPIQAEKDFRTSLQIDKSNTDALDGLKLTSQSMSEQKKAEEIMQMRNFLQENWAQATTHEKTGDFSKAVSSYMNILNHYPDDLETQIRLGRALAFSSRTDDAGQLYTKLLESHPGNKEIILARAFLNLNSGKLDLAEKDLNSAVAVSTVDPEIENGFKLLSEKRKQAETDKIIAAEWEKADNFKMSGEYPSAIKTYENILMDHPNHLETQVRLAWVFRANGQASEARNIYEENLKQNPKSADLWIGLGHTFLDQNRFFDAEKSFKTAQGYLPENDSAQSELDSILKIVARRRIQRSAEAIENSGDLISAESRLKRALQTYPDDPDFLFQLARIQSRLDKLEESHKTYDQLIAIQADNTDYLVGKSLVYKKQGNLLESEAGFRKVLAVSPDHPDALMGMALISTAEKDYFRTDEILGKILEKDSTNSMARDRKSDLSNFVRERLIINSAYEKFTNLDNRTTHHAEYFHPFDSSFRGSMGVDLLRSSGNTDQSGFITANKDISRLTNIGGRISVAPDALLMARRTVEGEITQGIPGTPLSLIMLYRYMNFSTSDVHLYSPGILYYFNDHFSILGRAYVAELNNGNTQTGLIKFNYKANPYFTSYIGGAYGTGSSGFTASNQLIKTTTTSAQTGFNFAISDRLSAGFNYEYEDYKDQFTRNVFGLTFQFIF